MPKSNKKQYKSQTKKGARKKKSSGQEPGSEPKTSMPVLESSIGPSCIFFFARQG